MSIEDIKMMAAYMTIHGEHEHEQIAVGHTLANKVIGNLNGVGDLPALDEEKKKDFFALINGAPGIDKDEEDAFKRNLIIAAAIQAGNIEDPTGGATEFSKEPVKGSMKIKNMSFYKPQEAEVQASKPKSSKGRKTKGY